MARYQTVFSSRVALLALVLSSCGGESAVDGGGAADGAAPRDGSAADARIVAFDGGEPRDAAPAPDGGDDRDGATEDGALDSGALDSGALMGDLDASDVDAGRRDGGPRSDAGPSFDAFVARDAGLRDGGPRDGGPRDGGPRDAYAFPDAVRTVDARPVDAPLSFTPTDAHAFATRDTGLARSDGSMDMGSPARDCTATERAALLAAPTDANDVYDLRCSVTLDSTDRVRKAVRIATTGVRLHCGGALIDPTFGPGPNGYELVIRSQRSGNTFTPTDDVEVDDCRVNGTVRVYGMGANGQLTQLGGEPPVTLSSDRADWTALSQAAAPRNIRLTRLRVVADGGIPIYFGPGVTRSLISDSDLSGAGSLAIYFDAESAYNVVRRNHLHVSGPPQTDRRPREQMAIDGSAYNIVVENRITGAPGRVVDGRTRYGSGIFLYRNCGEGGVSRHQPPTQNFILANVFDLRGTPTDSEALAVHVGSRQGAGDYCAEDDDHDFGSGASNLDFAQYNVVADNVIVGRAAADTIEISDGPTYVRLNRRNDGVITSSAPSPLRAGCVYRRLDGLRAYLAVGQTSGDVTGDAPVTGTRFQCDVGDPLGTLLRTNGVPVTAVDATCAATGTRRSCQSGVVCPSGGFLAGMRAVCRLRQSALQATDLADTALSTVRVLASEPDAQCAVGNTSIEFGSTALDEVLLPDLASLPFGCQRATSGGPDCVAAAQAYCME